MLTIKQPSTLIPCTSTWSYPSKFSSWYFTVVRVSASNAPPGGKFQISGERFFLRFFLNLPPFSLILFPPLLYIPPVTREHFLLSTTLHFTCLHQRVPLEAFSLLYHRGNEICPSGLSPLKHSTPGECAESALHLVQYSIFPIVWKAELDTAPQLWLNRSLQSYIITPLLWYSTPWLM